MRPPPFAYADPQSLGEALGLLKQYGDEAKLLAGGQSLLPLLNFRAARPSYLVDLNRLSELDYIRPLDSGGLSIGALTRHRTVEQSALVRERCPLLHEAIQHVGHMQIRNRGTIGGSLAHADPSAELPAVVTALGGTLRVRGSGGERALSPAEFFISHLTTAIKPDEALIAVDLPGWPAGTGAAFTEFSRRQGDFALVGVGALLTLDAGGRVARIGLALMGVGGKPFDAATIANEILRGERPDDAKLHAVAERVATSIEPNSDLHAPADYRKHLANVMTRRALMSAARRAGTGRGGQ